MLGKTHIYVFVFVPLHRPHNVPHFSFVFFGVFFQALDSAGVPGMDRVDSLAEYLVELRNQPSLTLTNQQVRKIQVSLLSLLNLPYVLDLFSFLIFSHYMLSLIR